MQLTLDYDSERNSWRAAYKDYPEQGSIGYSPIGVFLTLCDYDGEAVDIATTQTSDANARSVRQIVQSLLGADYFKRIKSCLDCAAPIDKPGWCAACKQLQEEKMERIRERMSIQGVLVYGIPIKLWTIVEDGNADAMSYRVGRLASDYDEVPGKSGIFSVRLEPHGSAYYTGYIAAITENVYRSDFLKPLPVQQREDLLHVWDSDLKHFCEEFELQTDGDPGWYLASYYSR